MANGKRADIIVALQGKHKENDVKSCIDSGSSESSRCDSALKDFDVKNNVICPATATKISELTGWIDNNLSNAQLSAEELIEKIRVSGDLTRMATMNHLAHLGRKTLNAMAPELITLLAVDPADWSLCDRTYKLLEKRVDTKALVNERVLTKIHEVLQVEDLACREDILRLLMRIMGAPGGIELISSTPTIGDAVVKATTNFRGQVLDASHAASEPVVTLAEAMIATIEAPQGLKRAADDAAYFAELPALLHSAIALE